MRERTAPLKYTVDDDLNLSDDDDDDNVPFPTTRQVIVEWLHEDALDLWEIRQYWEKVEAERNLRRERQQAEEDARKNLEAKRAALLRRQAEQMIKQQQQQQRKIQKPSKPTAELQKIPTVDSKLTIRPVISGTPTIVSRPVTVTTTKLTPSPSFVTVPGKPGLIVQRGITQAQSLLLQSQQQKQRQITQQSPAQKVYNAQTPLQVPVSVARPLPLASPNVARSSLSTTTSNFINRTNQNALSSKPQHDRKVKRKQPIASAPKTETIVTSTPINLASKGEKEEDKQKKPSPRRSHLNYETMRKLKRQLRDRKERLKDQILKKRQLLERNLLIEIGDELYNEEQAELNRGNKRKLDEDSTRTDSKKAKTTADEKLYCLCKTPYDEMRFYVGCDLCNNWFHGDCVGISEAQAESMDEFICDDCKRQQHGVEQEELYCLCKQPYDESKFYIGCDVCQDWFHGTCVGITQAEADYIDNYVCPRCSSVNAGERIENKALSQKDIEGLKRLLRSLQSHKTASPFLEPVDELEVSDYYEIVKEPMDLQTMESKLRLNKYKTIKDFVADASRIFDNCRYYNTSDSPFYRCAEVLENFFVQKLKAFKNTLQKVSK